MLKYTKIKVGGRTIEALALKLADKNLIVLRGSRGYIMCGYLNLKVAERFKDVAVKVTGVSTIKDVLGAVVHSCTSPARRMGIRKAQKIKDILKIIA